MTNEYSEDEDDQPAIKVEKEKKKKRVINLEQKSQKCTISPTLKNLNKKLYFPHQKLLQPRK